MMGPAKAPRKPTRAAVVSPHPLANAAGARVLRQGGNAVEAAVAVGAVLAVVYPHFCGLGGDAVWMLADGEGRQTSLLGIGQGAEALSDAPSGAIPVRGPASTATTAAVVDSWQLALGYSARRWGGKLAPAGLLDEAIAHAENGFPLSRSQSHWLDFRAPEYASWPGFTSVFTPQNEVPKPGSRFVQPQLAQTLRLLARDGARSFYEGELARRIADGLAAAGSPISAADLARTRAREETPVSIDYRGYQLLAPPAPTQGITTLSIMGTLQHFDLSAVPHGSADYYHLCVEAVKQAFLTRGRIADPVFAQDVAAELLAPERLRRQADAVSPENAMPWPHQYRHGDTVFFGVIDDHGRCASVLQSIYFDWGSGVVVGDTGILWQNRAAAFSAVRPHQNEPAAGKRPFYTLNPGVALRDGKPALLYGTQGADGQPQTLSLLLTRMLDYGFDPRSALAAPRFLLGRTFSDTRDSLKLEADVATIVAADLMKLGHEVTTIEPQSPLSGQAGLIAISPAGEIDAAHDPRGDGGAIFIEPAMDPN